VLPACGSQQIHDGRIQENYASQLIALTGIYEGAIELDTKDRKIVYPAIGKTQIELKIKINGEIQLSTKHDLLGEGCGSHIGKLEEFRELDSPDGQVFDSYFYFDPGSCVEKVESKKLLLESRKDCKGEPFLEILIVKEYVGSFRHARSLRYHGVFKKVHQAGLSSQYQVAGSEYLPSS
jgi:hypothetical protein